MSKLNELFNQKLHVVNFGIESFYDDLKGQGEAAVHVDWKPVAGGDKAAGELDPIRGGIVIWCPALNAEQKPLRPPEIYDPAGLV